jgi:hypothetical protein
MLGPSSNTLCGHGFGPKCEDLLRTRILGPGAFRGHDFGPKCKDSLRTRFRAQVRRLVADMDSGPKCEDLFCIGFLPGSGPNFN